uniref:O-fucosyltransferase family protein n=1 Tax=Coccolithus braarudii TaxID=221442 RepID=A0A7S0Q5S7_9EUKA
MVRHKQSRPARPLRGQRALISFSVCGGLLNQRLAMIDALMIGHLLDATVLLPSLNLNGRQTGAQYSEEASQVAPFTAFFDFAATSAALLPLVRVVPNNSQTAQVGKIRQVSGRLHPAHWYENLLDAAAIDSSMPWIPGYRRMPQQQLRFGCTFAGLDKRDNESMQQLFWKIDAALMPATQIQDAAGETIKELRARSERLGGHGRFNALHLRVEEDWVEHCARWESRSSQPPRDNCMTNTDALHSVFAIEGVEEEQPLYVATEESGVQLRKTRGLANLANYKLESKSTLWKNEEQGNWLRAHRELGAFHDLLVCRSADRFIGNSVSTFSAYLEMARERDHGAARARDFHYNGGNIPLQDVYFGQIRLVNSSLRRLKRVVAPGEYEREARK